MECTVCKQSISGRGSTGLCRACYAQSEEGKKKNSEGGKLRNRSQREIYKNTPQEVKARMSWSAGKLLKDPQEVFINLGDTPGKVGKNTIKKYLLQELGHQCNKCKNSEWLGLPIALEIEHKDGNHLNNERSNLELLCPNCHATTPTWRGRNIKSSSERYKVSDDEVAEAITNSKDIASALLSLNLVPKGGNYGRVYRVLFSRGLTFKTR